MGVFETFVEYFLAFVPFYYEFKLVVLLWLVSPQFQGARQAVSPTVSLPCCSAPHCCLAEACGPPVVCRFPVRSRVELQTI